MSFLTPCQFLHKRKSFQKFSYFSIPPKMRDHDDPYFRPKTRQAWFVLKGLKQRYLKRPNFAGLSV